MTKFTSLTVAAFLAFATSNLSQGAVIVEYDFGGDGAADVVHSNASATAFTPGSGLTSVGFGARASAKGWFPETNAVDAGGAGNYWEFIVTADSGYHFDLTNLTFSEIRGAIGPTNFDVAVNGNTVGTFISLNSLTARNINLALPLFTDITSATIRFTAYNAASNAGASAWNIDNVVLNGAVVPEPSACILAFALGIPGLVVAGRRKKPELVTAAV